MEDNTGVTETNEGACMLVIGIPITLTSNFQLKKHYENRGDILDVQYARTLGQALIYFKNKNSAFMAIAHSRKYIYGAKVATSIASTMRQKQFFNDLAQEKERRAEFISKLKKSTLGGIARRNKNKKSKRRNKALRNNKRSSKKRHNRLSSKKAKGPVQGCSFVASDEEFFDCEDHGNLNTENEDNELKKPKRAAKKRKIRKRRLTSLSFERDGSKVSGRRKKKSKSKFTDSNEEKSVGSAIFDPQKGSEDSEEETNLGSSSEVDGENNGLGFDVFQCQKEKQASDEETNYDSTCEVDTELNSSESDSKKKKRRLGEQGDCGSISADKSTEQFRTSDSNQPKKLKLFCEETYFDELSDEDQEDEYLSNKTYTEEKSYSIESNYPSNVCEQLLNEYEIELLPNEDVPKRTIDCPETYFYDKNESYYEQEPSGSPCYQKLHTRDPKWPVIFEVLKKTKDITKTNKLNENNINYSLENEKSSKGKEGIDHYDDFGSAFRVPKTIPGVPTDPRLAKSKRIDFTLAPPPLGHKVKIFENRQREKYKPISPMSDYCPFSPSSDAEDKVENFKNEIISINKRIDIINNLFKKQDELDKKTWVFPTLEEMSKKLAKK